MDNGTRQNRVREALGKIYDQHPPYFREYLQRFKEDPTSRVFAPLAEAYRRMGRVDEAIDICREGLEHHPDFHGGRVALAKCFVDKRMYAEAQMELERVVKAVPENLLAQRLLGDAYFAQGNKAAALHPYKMALLLSPSDVALADRVHGLEKALHQSGVIEKPAAPMTAAEMIPLEDPRPKAMPKPPLDNVGAKELDARLAEWDLDPMEDLTQVAQSPAAERSAPRDEAAASAPALFTQSEEEESDLGDDERARIDELLGVTGDEPEEAFKIEHVSAVFAEEPAEAKKEITTSTLGDLYFSQGQYDRALRIYEKLAGRRPPSDIARKINACRAKLGVDKDAIVRNRKIHALRMVLKKVREESFQLR